MLCAYYAVRPLRDTFGIERGPDALPWLYTGTAAFSLLLHPLFTRAVSRWPRRRCIPWTYHVFVLNLVVFFGLLVWMPDRPLFTFGEVTVGTTEAVGYVFFVWLSVFNVFITSVFWSFMTDVFTPDQGRRLFGALAAGGSAGAIVGGAVAWQLTESLGRYTMILIAVLFLELAVLCVLRLGRSVGGEEAAEVSAGGSDAAGAAGAGSDARSGEAVGGGALDGVRHVMSSPYLGGIAGLMLLMTLCNTSFYTQQAEIVEASFESRDERTAYFGLLDMLTNIATLVLQFVVVGRLLRGAGIVVTLVVLPVTFALCFVALANKGVLAAAGLPTLTLLGVCMVATRAGRYAVLRPAREVLYTVVSRADKYKAKNFNDTFVYRGGDLVAIWGDKLMRLFLSSPGIAYVGAGVAAVMGALGVALGRGQERRAVEQSAGDDEAA